MLVGATKEEGNNDTCPTVSGEEYETVCEDLIPKAAALYPPIRDWQVASVRAGVRAAPPRTALGNIPIAGFLGEVPEEGRKAGVWLVGGLGSRGLIYHGVLGEEMGRAVIRRDEGERDAAFRQWKGVKSERKRRRHRPWVRGREDEKVRRRERRKDAEAGAGRE